MEWVSTFTPTSSGEISLKASVPPSADKDKGYKCLFMQNLGDGKILYKPAYCYLTGLYPLQEYTFTNYQYCGKVYLAVNICFKGQCRVYLVPKDAVKCRAVGPITFCYVEYGKLFKPENLVTVLKKEGNAYRVAWKRKCPSLFGIFGGENPPMEFATIPPPIKSGNQNNIPPTPPQTPTTPQTTATVISRTKNQAQNTLIIGAMVGIVLALLLYQRTQETV